MAEQIACGHSGVDLYELTQCGPRSGQLGFATSVTAIPRAGTWARRSARRAHRPGLAAAIQEELLDRVARLAGGQEAAELALEVAQAEPGRRAAKSKRDIAPCGRLAALLQLLRRRPELKL